MFELQKLKNFYSAGNTLSYDSRIQSLKALLNAVLKYEEAIYAALYDDLKKKKITQNHAGY